MEPEINTDPANKGSEQGMQLSVRVISQAGIVIYQVEQTGEFLTPLDTYSQLTAIPTANLQARLNQTVPLGEVALVGENQILEWLKIDRPEIFEDLPKVGYRASVLAMMEQRMKASPIIIPGVQQPPGLMTEHRLQ
jgi:hypothetical protein